MISQRAFMTAAHCVAWEPWKSFELGVAFAADFQVTGYSTVAPGVAVYPAKAHAHPDFTFDDAFDEFSTDPDVAILLLDKPLKGMKPATLVESGFFDGEEGAEVLRGTFGVAGYGISSRDAVQRFFEGGPLDFSARRYTTMTLDHVYSAMVVFNGSNGCFEDSGGPAFPVHGKATKDNIPKYVGTVTALLRTELREDLDAGHWCGTRTVFTRLDTPKIQSFVRSFLSKDDSQD